MRTHLWKLIKRRSENIRTAVNALNAAAKGLSPPRPPIAFKTVISHAFLGELDLLRHARQDIRTQPWANQNQRVLMDHWFRMEHAKEELVRLNVEMRRLRTWIRDETQVYDNAVAALRQEGKEDLAVELEGRARYQFRVNAHIWSSLDKVEKLKGFTGIRSFGYSEEQRLTGEAQEGRAPDTDGTGSNPALGRVASSSLPLVAPPSSSLPSIASQITPSQEGDDSSDSETEEQQLDDLEEVVQQMSAR